MSDHKADHQPREIILIGPHSSGKSTLGRALADALGVPFDDEIGRHLRDELLAQDASKDAMCRVTGFDDAVFERELARDALALERPATGPWLRVVETWHPGNLSYAMARDPGASRFMYAAHQAILRRPSQPLCIPLCVRPETLRDRLSEPAQDAEAMLLFLRRVAQTTARWCRRWALPMTPTLWTDERSPAETLEHALALLHERSARHQIR